MPDLLTEINEISNSSAYQDFYDIDFETSGIALDIAETKTNRACSRFNMCSPHFSDQTSGSPIEK